MSRFYGSMSGSAKTDATRQGTANSGISGHVRGWDGGVLVHGIAVDDVKEKYVVYATRGSNAYGPDRYLVTVDENGTITDVGDAVRLFVEGEKGK